MEIAIWYSPLSLINLQVSLGGLRTSEFSWTTYQRRFWRIDLINDIGNNQNGILLMPRNINISFNNDSAVVMDVILLIFSSDEIVLDVEQGS